MIKVINTEKKPIKLWLDDIEDTALEQAKNLANLPFTFRHVAIMPDSHLGYGMPIGGVLATLDKIIIPNAVGVDIGCGMCAVRTSLANIQIDELKVVMGLIRKKIPVGFKHHGERQAKVHMPDINHDDLTVVDRQYIRALKQIGTLGGGNHFIEIQKGSDGAIWIMIHSGSRNLGKLVADFYNKIAIDLNEKWRSSVPKNWQLAFLPFDSDEGNAYYNEMKYCVEFAFKNRLLMMERIKEIFVDNISIDIQFDEMINIAHNYAAIENHYRQNVMVHRKGATLASEDLLGIIPGSQGSKSYIVRGLGNQNSFNSCSHGAGRKMGRKQAIRELNYEKEVKKLDSQGILHSIRGKKDLDEASGAYKDIEKVMSNQADLVDIVVELCPLGVVKG